MSKLNWTLTPGVNSVQTGLVAKMTFQAVVAAIGYQQPIPTYGAPGKRVITGQPFNVAHLGGIFFYRDDGTGGSSENGQVRGAAALVHDLNPKSNFSNLRHAKPTCKSICVALICASVFSPFPAVAQVPTNDAHRTGKETNIRVCTERARTYKRQTEAPTSGVNGSFADKGGGGSQSLSGKGNVMGTALGGTSVGGVDLAGIMALVGSVAALKSKNAGQVSTALSAVTAAIQQNNSGLSGPSTSIGSVNSIQGAFDQNSSGRLSQGSIWGQAVQSGTTTLQLRNQQLLGQTSAASAAANIMAYDRSKARLVDDRKVQSDNAEQTSTDTSSLEAIEKDLARRQEDTMKNALNKTPPQGNGS